MIASAIARSIQIFSVSIGLKMNAMMVATTMIADNHVEIFLAALAAAAARADALLLLSAISLMSFATSLPSLSTRTTPSAMPFTVSPGCVTMCLS